MFHLRLLVPLGLVLFALLVTAYVAYGLQPVSGEWSGGGSAGAERNVPFTIERGEGFRDIAARLSRESLVRSISVFKLYAVVTGNAQRLQPGTYELTPVMSVPDILSALTAGGATDVTVTIPEGSTALDTVGLMTAAGVPLSPVLAGAAPATFDAGYFLERYPYLAGVSSFEGILFPDTYRFRRDSTNVRDTLGVLLAGFHTKAWPLFQGRSDWYERLILASYLEREVPTFDDRATVAGILLKRLRRTMPLQVDATISYAKCRGSFRGCATIPVTRADLAIRSPYNTYQSAGWTPTPIANPGESAIRAALTPKETPYLYYLSDPQTKRTIFSRTLEEHNANRARYL